jgi:hypothetical protein
MKHVSTYLGTLAILTFSSSLFAGDDKVKYDLDAGGADVDATAEVSVDGEKLKIKIRDAHPNALYTIWIDFRKRSDGNSLPVGFPVDGRAVAPAIASTDPVYDGMRLDLNGVLTDNKGDADFNGKLDFELLKEGDTPVVGAMLAVQGVNHVGGYWLRVYNPDEFSPDTQEVDPETGAPILQRSTARGITIVRHLDFVTHGHTPGLGGTDIASAFKGDFPTD